MYGLAYVIFSGDFDSLQSALDEQLSAFRRGGLDDFPRQKLAFDDISGELKELHDQAVILRSDGGGVALQCDDPKKAGNLDFDALRELLQSMDALSWRGRLADVEPDFDTFARRFTKWKQRDPEVGEYGCWQNPLGRWDWWELGGRYDGYISGQPRAGSGSQSMISSGPSRGRELLDDIVRSLGGKPSEYEAEITANVELVSSLKEAARRGERHAFPTAIVLPADAGEADLRWFDVVRRPPLAETRSLLSAPEDATFNEMALAAYERFEDRAAAGIAYHF